MHETLRYAQPVGEASPARHPPDATRAQSAGDRQHGQGIGQLGVSVAAPLPSEGDGRSSATTRTGSSGTAVFLPEAARGPAAVEGRARRRLLHRLVDPGADWSSDREAVSRDVPPGACLEADACTRVELPEAGTPCAAAGRASHRALEAVSLAAYKKTLSSLGRIWRSSTRVASSSFRTLSGPGPRKARRRTRGTSINRGTSPPLARWRSLPSSAAWRCTCASKPAASTAWMSVASSGICCAICTDRWSCSGIGGRFIAGVNFKSSSGGIPGFTSSRFRPTRRNSTPLNTSGARATVGWPTVRQSMSRPSTDCSALPFRKRAPRSRCCGPVFMRPNFHGQTSRFLYLCKTQ